MESPPSDEDRLVNRIADAVVTRIEEQRRIDWIVTAVLKAMEERKQQEHDSDSARQGPS